MQLIRASRASFGYRRAIRGAKNYEVGQQLGWDN